MQRAHGGSSSAPAAPAVPKVMRCVYERKHLHAMRRMPAQRRPRASNRRPSARQLASSTIHTLSCSLSPGASSSACTTRWVQLAQNHMHDLPASVQQHGQPLRAPLCEERQACRLPGVSAPWGSRTLASKLRTANLRVCTMLRCSPRFWLQSRSTSGRRVHKVLGAECQRRRQWGKTEVLRAGQLGGLRQPSGPAGRPTVAHHVSMMLDSQA